MEKKKRKSKGSDKEPTKIVRCRVCGKKHRVKKYTFDNKRKVIYYLGFYYCPDCFYRRYPKFLGGCC